MGKQVYKGQVERQKAQSRLPDHYEMSAKVSHGRARRGLQIKSRQGRAIGKKRERGREREESGYSQTRASHDTERLYRWS